MKKGDVIFCFIWIFIAIWVAFQSIGLKLGQPSNPGPGLLPFFSSVVIGILAFILLFSLVFKGKGREETKEEGSRFGEQWIKAAYLLIGSSIYILVMWENLGYLISTIIFLFFLLKFVGSRSFIKSVLFSLTTTVISYLIFQVWLKCLLPEGLMKYLKY